MGVRVCSGPKFSTTPRVEWSVLEAVYRQQQPQPGEDALPFAAALQLLHQLGVAIMVPGRVQRAPEEMPLFASANTDAPKAGYSVQWRWLAGSYAAAWCLPAELTPAAEAGYGILPHLWTLPDGRTDDGVLDKLALGLAYQLSLHPGVAQVFWGFGVGCIRKFILAFAGGPAGAGDLVAGAN